MKHILKRLMSLALVFCMTAAMVVTAHAEGDPSAKLSMSAKKSGDTVVVSIILDSAANAAGVDLTLSYDSDKLSYAGLSDNAVFGGGADAVDKGGSVKLMFGPGGNKDSASGTLGTVTFNIKDSAVGDASFSISNGHVADASGNTKSVSYGTTSASVTVREPSYSISKASTSNGSFDLSATSAHKGDTITVTTKPNTGYEVKSVTYNGSSASKKSDNSYTFTMPAENVTVSVEFQKAAYKVNVASVSNGNKVSVDKTSANYGDTVTVTLTPAAEYLASGVTVSGGVKVSGSGNTYTFTMPANDVTVTGSFTAKTYKVTVSAGANGTAKADKTSAAKDATVTVTTSPAAGYVVDTVTVNGTSVSGKDNKYTFKMPGKDAAVSVTFKEATYSVSVGKTSNGTVKVDKTSNIKAGETVTITVTPDTEYLLKEISATGATVNKKNDTTYTFTMPAKDVTVNATFAAKTYDVTVSAGKHGSAKVDKAAAAKGDTVTVTVSPDAGYEVKEITVGDATVTKKSDNTYTFTMPGKATKVSISFQEATYKVTVAKTSNGTVKVDKTSGKAGDKVTITVTPNDGYEVSKVSVSGATVKQKNDTTYTFQMPTKDAKVSVTFSKIGGEEDPNAEDPNAEDPNAEDPNVEEPTEPAEDPAEDPVDEPTEPDEPTEDEPTEPAEPDTPNGDTNSGSQGGVPVYVWIVIVVLLVAAGGFLFLFFYRRKRK